MGDLVGKADAVVHSIGLLFDVESGLQNLNLIVSGSKSVPGEDSTYDRITRLTAFNTVEALTKGLPNPFGGFRFSPCRRRPHPHDLTHLYFA